MYIDASLRTYLEDLAARKPAPGGGSAAALAAAIGSSLVSMVANYTAGNPRYRTHEAAIADAMVKAQQLNARLYDLIDEDVAAYKQLSRHMKGLADDPAAKQKAFRDAVRPPFEVCEVVAESMCLCKELAMHGNTSLISDVAVAALIGEAAFVSARYNVLINLAYITDAVYVKRTHERLDPLAREVSRLRGEIVARCDDVMGTRKD